MTPGPELRPEILDHLIEINGLRSAGGPLTGRRSELESYFAETYEADQRLAVYGSLAPGRVNHHVVQPLGGRWKEDLVTHGDLEPRGWGAGLGFPALRWRPDGPDVAVTLLTSPRLPAYWSRLDEFEGREYVRILVPVFSKRGFVTITNLYQVGGPG